MPSMYQGVPYISFQRGNERSNPSDLKAYGRPGVKLVGSMSRKTPKGFGLCTHPDVRCFSGQTHVCTRLYVAYSIFHVFLGMIKETSKDKKWSIGAKESAAGQGKGTYSSPGYIRVQWP